VPPQEKEVEVPDEDEPPKVEKEEEEGGWPAALAAQHAVA
jgi:hypothetical protein